MRIFENENSCVQKDFICYFRVATMCTNSKDNTIQNNIVYVLIIKPSSVLIATVVHSELLLIP